jgi:transposase InsO family protein
LTGHGRLTAARCALDGSARRLRSSSRFLMCYGVQFTRRKQDIWDFQHIFDRVCDEHGIEHRLTRVNHPWTNGQVERMNRTIKDATVKRYHYDNHDQLRTHLGLFVDAYNHARRLKTLRGLTPYEFVCQVWTKEPERFRLNPPHHIPGPYT